MHILKKAQQVIKNERIIYCRHSLNQSKYKGACCKDGYLVQRAKKAFKGAKSYTSKLLVLRTLQDIIKDRGSYKKEE